MPPTLRELDVNVVIDIRMEAAPLQSDISNIVGMDDVKHPQQDLFLSTLLTPVRGTCLSFSLGRWLLQIEPALKYKVLLNSLHAFWLQSFALSSLVLNRLIRLLSGLLHLRWVLQWMSPVKRSSSERVIQRVSSSSVSVWGVFSPLPTSGQEGHNPYGYMGLRGLSLLVTSLIFPFLNERAGCTSLSLHTQLSRGAGHCARRRMGWAQCSQQDLFCPTQH